MTILTEKFRFIRDDVFLCPQVDTETGQQRLKLEKINSETGKIEHEDWIDCIHTVITQIAYDELVDYQEDVDFKNDLIKKTLNIRSIENLKEINLNPDEKFFAFKSWAQGIAESGIDTFNIQEFIDANFLYPIMSFFLRFMIFIDDEFIFTRILKIEQECRFEGVRHEASLLANLMFILDSIEKLEEMEEFGFNTSKIPSMISAILQIDPPLRLFSDDPLFARIAVHYNIDEFSKYLEKNISEENVFSNNKILRHIIKKKPTFLMKYLKDIEPKYQQGDEEEKLVIEKQIITILEMFFAETYEIGEFLKEHIEIIENIPTIPPTFKYLKSRSSYYLYEIGKINPNLFLWFLEVFFSEKTPNMNYLNPFMEIFFEFDFIGVNLNKIEVKLARYILDANPPTQFFQKYPEYLLSLYDAGLYYYNFGKYLYKIKDEKDKLKEIVILIFKNGQLSQWYAEYLDIINPILLLILDLELPKEFILKYDLYSEILESDFRSLSRYFENYYPRPDFYVCYEEAKSLDFIQLVTELKISKIFSVNRAHNHESRYISKNGHVIKLILKGNMDIKSIPRHVYDLTYLKELTIINTGIESLPADIGNLKKLKSLDLSFNKLKNLSENIGELKHLKYLNVQGNPLIELPGGKTALLKKIGKLGRLNKDFVLKI